MKKMNVSIFALALMLFSGLWLMAPAAGLADCPAGIVAYWKLDEASGPTYLDFIGDNDGTGNASPTAEPAGKVNGAQRFGLTLGIDVPAAKAFNWSATDSFSVELWMKNEELTAFNVSRVMVGRGTSASGVFWWVGLDVNRRPVFFLREEDGSSRRVAGQTAINDNQWYHLVAVRNGATDELSLYLDGALLETVATNVGNMTLGFATSAKLSIGYVDDLFRFRGLIDEVAIYDGVLPASVIQAHYASGTDYCEGGTAVATQFAPFPEETVALWPLDEAGGNTYVDVFGGNDGRGNASPTPEPAGKVNGAQRFGLTLGIDVPATKAFNWSATDSFSVELWMKNEELTAFNVSRVMVGRGTSASGVFWWVGLDVNRRPVFFLREEDGSSRRVAGQTAINDNQWYHLVAVRNGATDELSLYLDGALLETVATNVGNMTLGFATSAKLSLGYVDDLFRFRGLIDEVAIYDRVLLLAEIEDHFDAGMAGNGVESLRPAPTANAGPDQSNVPKLSVVTLDGTASALGYAGTTLSYLWSQTDGPAVPLTNATSATATFTAPDVDDSGATLTFQLTVTASDGQPAVDTVEVDVINLTGPVADAGADRTVAEGAAVTLDGSGSTEGTGSIVTYAWVQTAGTGVTLAGASTVTATFTAPQVDADEELIFELTVTDEYGLSNTATVTITVTDGGAPPAPSGGGGGGGCFINSLF